jgi:hypothetical protein
VGRHSLGSIWAGLIACAALCACGSQTTTPPVPASGPDFPASGASLTYVTSEWGTVSQPSASPQSIPTATFLEKETVSTDVTFGGRSHLIDIRTASSNPAQSSRSDDYLVWNPFAGGHILEEIAGVSSSKEVSAEFRSSGSSQTTFTQPAIQVQFPFASGNTWTDENAYRRTDSGSYQFTGYAAVKNDGRADWNADGSYVRNDGPELVAPGLTPTRSLVRVNSDGSASIEETQGTVRISKQTIGVPVRGRDGVYGIPVVISGLIPGTGSAIIPDWYPGGALPPSPLVASTVVDRGMAVLPASCGVPHSIATSGEKLVADKTQFDPTGVVSAITETTYYAGGIGMVCDEVFSRSSSYWVKFPSAFLVANETYHMTKALTVATMQPGNARTVALALANVHGRTLADAMRQHLAGLNARLRTTFMAGSGQPKRPRQLLSF